MTPWEPSRSSMRPLNVPTGSDTQIESVLRQIGRRVLDDVWIGGRVRAVTFGAVATLAGAALNGWLGTAARATAQMPTGWISHVAIGLFTLTAALSSVAVRLRRFRWCCAAAYIGGIATVAGLGMVWWHQTAPPGRSAGPAAWMVIGVLACVTLTVTWLGVILTPLERSQPDIRCALPHRPEWR